MVEHPVLGVGVQRFQEATREYYPDKYPYVAHNTFINIAAEIGVLAGCIFLSFYWIHFRNHKKIQRKNRQLLFYEYLNNASITAITGFYVCAMFLDLLIYEVFYLLLLLMLSNQVVSVNSSSVCDNKEKESYSKE